MLRGVVSLQRWLIHLLPSVILLKRLNGIVGDGKLVGFKHDFDAKVNLKKF